MYILVVNAGSSSLKYQLFEMEKEVVLAKGLCERIGLGESAITHKNLVTGAEHKAVVDMPTHNEATKVMIDCILDKDFGSLTDMNQISAIGHRIVQGGPWLTKPTLVTDEAIKDLNRCIVLAPLHTKPHLQGIQGCLAVMPNTPQVLVFDTSFHATIPEKASFFPIDYDVAKRNNIKRYGAHGTSHRYVANEAAKYLEKGKSAKIVTCHLGNGSSISAVMDGKVMDTSMGFTPLDGTIMGSRCGAIDPAVVPFVMEAEGISAADMGNWMNKKCGLLGVSGVSSDLRDVKKVMKGEDPNNMDKVERARLAFDILVYGIKKYVGSYTAAMNGLDAVVFTAGIGENDPDVRYETMKDMEFFGIEVDKDKCYNLKSLPAPCDISKDGSKVRIFVIPTNEELVIARDTKELVSNL